MENKRSTVITTICNVEPVTSEEGYNSFIVAGSYRISQGYVRAIRKLLFNNLKVIIPISDQIENLSFYRSERPFFFSIIDDFVQLTHSIENFSRNNLKKQLVFKKIVFIKAFYI